MQPRGEVNNEILKSKIDELKYDWICYLCNDMCLCKACTGKLPDKFEGVSDGKILIK